MFERQQSSLDPCVEGPLEMVDRPVVLLHGEDRRTSFQQPFREHTGSRSDLEDPRSAQITCEFQGSLQHSCVRQEVLSKVSVWCMETEERIDVGARRSGHGPTALGSLDADFLSDDFDDLLHGILGDGDALARDDRTDIVGMEWHDLSQLRGDLRILLKGFEGREP